VSAEKTVTVSGAGDNPATADGNDTAAADDDDAGEDDDKTGVTSPECGEQPPADTDAAEASADDLLRDLVPAEPGNVQSCSLKSIPLFVSHFMTARGTWT